MTAWTAIRSVRRWALLLAAAAAVGLALPADRAHGIQGTGSIFDDPEPGAKPPAPRPKPPPPAPRPKPGTPPAPGNPQPAGDQLAEGLVAEAFEGVGFSRSREKRVTKQISVTFRRDPRAAAPKPGDSAPLSFRWVGLIHLAKAGKYHFQVPLAADAVVNVGGKSVLRQTRAQALAGNPPRASVELPEGYHELRVEVSNIALAADAVRVQLLFGAGDSPQMEVLPAALLYHKTSDEGPAVEVTWGGGNDSKTTTQPPKPKPVPSVEHDGPGPAPAPARTAVPPDAAVNDARKAIRLKYASYYADKKPAIQMSLVKKLLADAEGATIPPPERYALLREAAETAAGAGELEPALAAVKTTSERFQIDESELAVAVLSISQRGMNKENAANWAEAALKLADTAMDSTRYDLASKAATLAEAAAKALPGAAGAPVAARAKERVNALRELRAEQSKLAAMFERLKAKADDPEANLRVGKFYCLVAADWTRGLAALAKGSDLELKALAELETSAQQAEKASKNLDAAERIKIGDLWYGRVSSEREPYKSRCRQRAAYWYKPAIESAADQETKDRLWDRCAEARGAIDLMALVDFKRDVVQGNRWERRGRDFWCHGAGANSLRFPYKPAREYNYLVEFTVTAGDNYFHHIFPAADNTSVSWVLGQYGKHMEYSTSGGSPPVMKLPGVAVGKQRHTSLIKVRNGLVRVYYDDKLACEWHASRFRGGNIGQIAIPEAALGVGCLNTTIFVHSAYLTEVRDDEQPAATAGAAAGGSGNGNRAGNTGGPRTGTRTGTGTGG